jgi:hypothetical protein
MPGTLDDWQERLDRHFRELSGARAESGYPIFALEHGLDAKDLAELTVLLHRHLASGKRLFPYWLLWAVYSTEQGYAYDGHEYWVSFEQNTPHWRDRGRPEYMRTYFSKFRQAYSGIVPSGPWAGTFRNIAWPITHAILPRYLQLQFARTLYEASHRFARMQNPTPQAAGKLLASNAWDATSRFQEFLEQEELTGRIVLALFEQGSVQSQSPIYEPTLKRIVDDLNNVRRAGEWLKAARRVVADRFHGVDRNKPGSAADRSALTSFTPQAPAPNVRPTLLLRRSSATQWSPVAEIPNFNDVAKLSPDLAQFLKTTRCTIAGTEGAMLPAGWLLYGSPKRVMKTWPQANVPMIEFERSNAVLDNMLRGECRFGQGPVWAFRIGSDGLAREILGKTVRPGQRYVILSRNPLEAVVPFISPVNVECEGVTGMLLEIPEAVQADETAALHRMGLEIARNIRVWPAGLCIRNWDGEGHGDWLSTEAPCFGIVHDYAVDEYYVRLNQSPELKIEGTRAGHPIFIRLPKLAPGRHVLSVRANRVGLRVGSKELRELQGRVELKVRDPAPWKAGTTEYSGLAVSIEPPDPSLDAFWEGNARVSVMGPEGREVACAITLTGRNGASLLAQEIGKFELPVTGTSWSQRFKRFANDESRAWKYLDASTGRFTIKGEELGEYALHLERDAKPVRWLCRLAAHDTQIRLIDDTGQDGLAETKFFSFRQPGNAQALNAATALSGFPAEEPGGLFFAARGDFRDALIVSSSRGAADFRDLLIEPDLSGLMDPLQLLALAELWREARSAGPLAENRRTLIAVRLLARLYTVLCGSRWAHAEEEFLRNRNLQTSQKLERAMEAEPRNGFAAALRHNYEKLSSNTTEGVKWFGDAARRYEVCDDAMLCSVALRLASWPFKLGIAYGEESPSLVQSVRDRPVLMRGARLLALLSIVSDTDHPDAYLPRWTW